MEYLLKASAIIAIFYVCYKLFLQGETFFQSNRLFFIVGLITSILFPLIVIPIYVTIEPQQFVFETTNIILPSSNTETPINWIALFTKLYFAGFVIFCVRLLTQVYSLATLIIRNKKQRSGKYIFVKVNDNISPFSFFNWIVFNPTQFNNNELEQIISHEKAHVNQLHSIDILLIQIATVVFWYNPLIWLYKKESQQNLEFIADANAQKYASCKKNYQHLLLKASMPSYQMALTNNFYNSLIKKRIVMLHKSKSNKLKAWKYLLTLPILALFLMNFSTKEIYTYNDENEFVVSAESTNADLEAIEDFFKTKQVKLRFTDLKRNNSNKIQRISINTKFPDNDRYIKRMTLNQQLKDDSIKLFKLIFNPNKNTINFSLANEDNSISTITSNNISFSENETIGKLKTNQNTKTVITKDFSKADLEQVKEDLAGKGVKLKFSGIKRNAANEIIAIKIEAKSDSANAKFEAESDKPISNILIKYNSEDDSIFIGSVSYSISSIYFSSDDGTHKIQKSGKGNPVFVYRSNDSTKIIKSSDSIILKGNIVVRSNNIAADTLWIENNNTQKVKGFINSKNTFVMSGINGETSKIDSIPFIIKNKDGNKIKGYKHKDGNVKNWNIENDTTYNIKNNSKNLSISGKEGKQPLIILDGKEIPNKEINDLVDPNNIKSINVLKGAAAIKLYGDKGKNGVVEIFSKSKTEKKNSFTNNDINIEELIKMATTVKGNNPVTSFNDSSKTPLFVLNDKEVSKNEISNLDRNKIETVFVLRGKAAIKLYGKKGKDGVIIITTKNK
jgi:bla regulator protein blaR1